MRLPSCPRGSWTAALSLSPCLCSALLNPFSAAWKNSELSRCCKCLGCMGLCSTGNLADAAAAAVAVWHRAAVRAVCELLPPSQRALSLPTSAVRRAKASGLVAESNLNGDGLTLGGELHLALLWALAAASPFDAVEGHPPLCMLHNCPSSTSPLALQAYWCLPRAARLCTPTPRRLSVTTPRLRMWCLRRARQRRRSATDERRTGGQQSRQQAHCIQLQRLEILCMFWPTM